MPWTRIVLITLGSGVVTSFTDWLFAGDWIHRRFTFPEIWREGVESKAIALTSPLPFLTCFVFACIAARLHVGSPARAFQLGVAIWLIAPLPLILSNAAWMKLHRVFVTSYAAGWMVKLLISRRLLPGFSVDVRAGGALATMGCVQPARSPWPQHCVSGTECAGGRAAQKNRRPFDPYS